MEAIWDLQSPSPPKAISLFPATGNANNPFEQNQQIALVFGTEQGSIHYRCFPSTKSNIPIQALQDRNIPRELYPIDLQNATQLQGQLQHPIVQCLQILPNLFLILYDDSKGSTTTTNTQGHNSILIAIRHGTMQVLTQQLPRMLAAAYHPETGLLFATGRTIYSMDVLNNQQKQKSFAQLPGIARNGYMIVTAKGRVAVIAVANTFYATDESPQNTVKLLTLTQSSQIHPTVIIDIQDESVDPEWNALFLANGRECAIVDLFWTATGMIVSKPRNGTVTFQSPILSAESSWPFVAVLTSDGLVSIRNPSCLAIPIRTIEIGTRPNDFFSLGKCAGLLVAVGNSGEGKVFKCYPDTKQDLADRLMRYAIDALGANGFPRKEVAQAINASFTATSYVGPEPTTMARILLVQYLEAILGLAEFESGASTHWPVGEGHQGSFSIEGSSGRSEAIAISESPALLLIATALYCSVESQMSQTASASRAAQICAGKVANMSFKDPSATAVCEMIAEQLLRDAVQSFSLLSQPTSTPSKVNRSSTSGSDLIEASIWLLRACDKHEKAINIAFERLQGGVEGGRSHWTQIKYESYIATHLSELWSSGNDEMLSLVLESPATIQLLERSPRLGLTVFTSGHPANEKQWKETSAKDDPLAKTEWSTRVVKLLKATKPTNVGDKHRLVNWSDENSLPLESGRALAITYLESAIGISSGRSISNSSFAAKNVHVADFHDELGFLLLQGVIAERRDDAETVDTDAGKLYRDRLQKLLQWPLAQIHADKFLANLPSSFQHERALVLGQLGRHEDALRILYTDLDDLDAALQYCDNRFQYQKARESKRTSPEKSLKEEEDNAYLPLIRVALESGKEKGTACAIQVLALRRNSVDRAAALRLLPSDVPVSAVARPFLIPALIDSESEERRLTVLSALLRARYLRLKDQLTSAQLKAQSQLSIVPQLRSLELGDPLHSTSAFKARTSSSSSSAMPEVMIVKHYFPRHLVIQAKVTNTSGGLKGGRVLSDVSFVVAESSEDALQPLLQVPIRLLPFRQTGCCWCVLSASPSRMDGPVGSLTCELRYTILSGDSVTDRGGGRNFVEELQDLEVQVSLFN